MSPDVYWGMQHMECISHQRRTKWLSDSLGRFLLEYSLSVPHLILHAWREWIRAGMVSLSHLPNIHLQRFTVADIWSCPLNWAFLNIRPWEHNGHLRRQPHCLPIQQPETSLKWQNKDSEPASR